MMKLVLKVDNVHDSKSQREALKSVSTLRGVDSLAVNKEKKTLTVVGNVDAVEVVQKLRKLMHVEIESAGPNKEEKKEDKKDEKTNKEMEELMRAYYYSNGYYPYYWPSNYTK